MTMLTIPDRPALVSVSAVPDPAALVRSLGFLTPADAARLDAIERARYVLVRIDGEGERWRCDRCNRKHAHFTYFCVERPFRGLRHGLLAYWQNVGAADPRDLTPAQRERLARLAPLFGQGTPIRPLAASHPETARKLATPETDVDIGAWVFGTIDPVTEREARLKAALINARARRTVVRL